MNSSTIPAAADRVYEHVKNRILDRTYPGGTLLSEGEIAADVGVSRTPVREALLRLETEGLLKLYPKKGALVIAVSPKEVADVIETRRLVEVFAALKALPRAERLLPRLEELVDVQRMHARAGDTRGFVEADRTFHRVIVDAAGNEIISKLFGMLRDRQLRMGVAMMEDEPSRMDLAVAEHEAIVEALRARDADAVSAAVEEHLDTVAATLGRLA